MGDRTTQRITPTVGRWRNLFWTDFQNENNDSGPKKVAEEVPLIVPLCAHDAAIDCGCIIPLECRTARAFNTGPTRLQMSSMYLKSKIQDALLLELDLETLFRAFGNPDPRHCSGDVRANWSNGISNQWAVMIENAMRVYVTLNIIFLLPQTWDPKTKLKPWHDYRDTVHYQRMIQDCTGTATGSRYEGQRSSTFVNHEPTSFAHRDFFDIPDRNLILMPWSTERGRVIKTQTHGSGLLGCMPFSAFINSKPGPRRQLPRGRREVDLQVARGALRRRGLPTEIVDMIIDWADERPWRFKVRDDPLHPDNHDVLKHYLNYLWELMVVCIIVGRVDKTTHSDSNPSSDNSHSHSEPGYIRASFRYVMRGFRDRWQ